MRNFKNYLLRQGYKDNSVRTYCNKLQLFFDWCEDSDVNPRAANLNELYDFIDYYRNIGNKVGTLREKKKIIVLYYKQIGRKTNPALLLRIEKQEKKLPKNLLDNEALLELYLGYIPKNITQKRNKCILGLMIFQGLSNISIEALEEQHVKLDKKKIYVPSTAKTNSRELKLRESQKHDFESYLYEIRPMLLREAKRETSKLFFSYGESDGLGSVFQRFKQELKRQAPYLKSFPQLRESRVKLWLKEHGMRETQYLAGMRFVSSLERYKDNDKEALKSKLKVVHPMERLGIN